MFWSQTLIIGKQHLGEKKTEGEMCEMWLEKSEPFICTKVQTVEKLLSHTFQTYV